MERHQNQSRKDEANDPNERHENDSKRPRLETSDSSSFNVAEASAQVQAKLAALRAKKMAMNLAQQTPLRMEEVAASPSTAVPLGVSLSVTKSAFATTKANQRLAAKKESKLAQASAAAAAIIANSSIKTLEPTAIKPPQPPKEEFNPYLAAVQEPILVKAHKSRPLKFIQKGKFTAIVSKLRKESELAELQQSISANKDLPDIYEEKKQEAVMIQQAIPNVEWWDEPLLPSRDYADLDKMENGVRIGLCYDFINSYVHHPAAIRILVAQEPVPVRKVMLTKEEMKKMRRQRRREELLAHQEKVRLGILPPDPPKVKLSNLMKVLGQQAVQDPTAVEASVRAQVEARRLKHESDNASRAVSGGVKAQRKQDKIQHELNQSTSVQVSVFLLHDLSHRQWQFKLEKNAQQLLLTGCAIIHSQCNLVIVEGAARALDKYTKLLMRRIKWTEKPAERNSNLDDGQTKSHVHAPITIENECRLVWTGAVRESHFKLFSINPFPLERDVVSFLERHESLHYWQQAQALIKRSS